MRRAAAALLAAAVVTAGGCSRSSAPDVRLDGSPRRADAEGEVLAASREEVVLDGDRRYRVSDQLRCFSSSTLKPLPLAGRVGTYVQVGLQGRTIRWMAAYGAVLRLPGRPATAIHVGTVAEAGPRSVTFRDGSVLAVADGVQAPAPGAQVRAEIDVGRRAVGAFGA